MKKSLKRNNVANLLKTIQPVMEDVIAKPVLSQAKDELKQILRNGKLKNIEKTIKKGDNKSALEMMRNLSSSLENFEKRMNRKAR